VLHGVGAALDGLRLVWCDVVVESVTVRRATRFDVDALRTLADASIAELQRNFLTEDQIQASRVIMGIDSQLIDDGTYFVVEIGGHLAGCGGWSRRATLYGADETSGRDAALLDPRADPAGVRAMYTSPAFARRGVGRRIFELCAPYGCDPAGRGAVCRRRSISWCRRG
jgi:GNAT superfamily N-acetyltransferase